MADKLTVDEEKEVMYTIETTRLNLEKAYNEKWFSLKNSIICPALELTFSVDKFGALDCEADKNKLHLQQEKVTNL